MLFTNLIKEQLGYEIAIGAFYGLDCGVMNLNGIPVYAKGSEAWGNDVLAANATHFGADIVITLMDAWVLKPNTITRIRWVPWAPVDHHPIPGAVERVLRFAWQPIAYSRFGYEEMKKADLSPEYVPHGIDTKRFRLRNKEDARTQTKMPQGALIYGMVAANKGIPSRKAFYEVFAAFAMLLEKHDDVYLYVHSERSERMQGLNLPECAKFCGIPDDRIGFPDPFQYLLSYPTEVMAKLYSSFDVFVNPAYGEGFGIPIVEAQAAGVPVILNNVTSMPELCFAGWLTDHYPMYTPLAGLQFPPKIEDIYRAMLAAYDLNDGERKEMRQKARRGALKYDAEKVTGKYWKPVLEKLEGQIDAGGQLESVQF